MCQSQVIRGVKGAFYTLEARSMSPHWPMNASVFALKNSLGRRKSGHLC